MRGPPVISEESITSTHHINTSLFVFSSWPSFNCLSPHIFSSSSHRFDSPCFELMLVVKKKNRNWLNLFMCAQSGLRSQIKAIVWMLAVQNGFQCNLYSLFKTKAKDSENILVPSCATTSCSTHHWPLAVCACTSETKVRMGFHWITCSKAASICRVSLKPTKEFQWTQQRRYRNKPVANRSLIENQLSYRPKEVCCWPEIQSSSKTGTRTKTSNEKKYWNLIYILYN